MMSNEKLEEKPPQDNWIVCTLVSVKIKQGAESHVWHKFYGEKMGTVNTKDVELLTVKLADDSEEINWIKQEHDKLEHYGNDIKIQTMNLYWH